MSSNVKAVTSYCRKVNERLRPIASFLEAAAGGWTDGDGRAISEREALEDRCRAMVHELQNLAVWATLNVPHHVGLTKREGP
jgi:hypothetical protein